MFVRLAGLHATPVNSNSEHLHHKLQVERHPSKAALICWFCFGLCFGVFFISKNYYYFVVGFFWWGLVWFCLFGVGFCLGFFWGVVFWVVVWFFFDGIEAVWASCASV